jgi:hypothetical protein
LGLTGGFTTPLDVTLTNPSFSLNSSSGIVELLDNGSLLLSFTVSPVTAVTTNPYSFSVTGTAVSFDNATVSALARGTFVGANESNVTFTAAVPEPSTWAMMILGFLGLGYMGYRRTNGRLRVA